MHVSAKTLKTTREHLKLIWDHPGASCTKDPYQNERIRLGDSLRESLWDFHIIKYSQSQALVPREATDPQTVNQVRERLIDIALMAEWLDATLTDDTIDSPYCARVCQIICPEEASA